MTWNNMRTMQIYGPCNEGMCSTERRPSHEVWDEDDSVVLELEMPGVDKEAIVIKTTETSLEIKTEEQVEIEDKESGEVQSKSYASFYKKFSLPKHLIDADKTSAEYKNGILKIVLPKVEASKAKTVKVK